MRIIKKTILILLFFATQNAFATNYVVAPNETRTEAIIGIGSAVESVTIGQGGTLNVTDGSSAITILSTDQSVLPIVNDGSIISNLSAIDIIKFAVNNNNQNITIANNSLINTTDNGFSAISIFNESNGSLNLTIANKGSVFATSNQNSNGFAISASSTVNNSIITINNSKNTQTNVSGRITGDIDLSTNTTTTITNSAKDFGAIARSGQVDNSLQGGIYGNITSAGNLTLTNSGNITGNITQTNTGKIILTNTGTITGNIDLGNNLTSEANFSNGIVTGNLSLGVDSTAISISSDSQFNGNIINKSNNPIGVIVFTGTSATDKIFSLGGNVGSSNQKLSSVTIRGIDNFSFENYRIYAENVDIDSSVATLGRSNSINSPSNLFVAGNTAKLNLGDVYFVTGFPSIALSSGATLDFSDRAHSYDGSLWQLNGKSFLETTINSNSQFGYLDIDSSANISNLGLKINVNANANNFINNPSFDILSAITNGSDLSAISDDEINVNNQSTNKLGLVTFTTSVSEANSRSILTVNTNFDRNGYVANSASNQGVFNNLVAINNLDGELLQIANYLIATNNVSNENRNNVLKEISTNNIGINQVTYSSLSNVVSVIENRNAENFHNFINDNPNANCAFSDFNIANSKCDKIGVWAQITNQNAKQKNKNGFEGYNVRSNGLVFGFDKKIDNKSLAGVAFGISDNYLKGANNQRTEIKNYQLSLYGSKDMGGYFLDGTLSAALNRYESNRAISVIGKVANANYNGQTYLAKIKASQIKKINDKIDFIPEIALFAANNRLDNYAENGAGNANLNVKNKNSNLFETSIGGTLRYNSINFKESKIFPKIKLAYGYDFAGNKQISTANFQSQNSTFINQTSKANRQALRFDAGFDLYSVNQATTISANYGIEKKHGYSSRLAFLKLNYEF